MVPPTEPYALRSTQPLKVSTRDFSWGKGGRCIWLTTYLPCSAETSRNSGALIYSEPVGPPRSVAGDIYFYLWVLRKFFSNVFHSLRNTQNKVSARNAVKHLSLSSKLAQKRFVFPVRVNEITFTRVPELRIIFLK